MKKSKNGNTDTRSIEPSSFDRISDEIKINIFEYLPRSQRVKLSYVSKDWKKLAEDPLFWKSEFIALVPDADEEELDFIKNNGGFKNAIRVY